VNIIVSQVLNNQKSKNALDAWMKDLAGTRPLFQLAKKVGGLNCGNTDHFIEMKMVAIVI